MTYPRSFSHIGISVTDLDQAVDFYTKTLGWYVIMPPTEVVSDDSAIGVMCNDVFEIYSHSYELTYSAGAYQGDSK